MRNEVHSVGQLAVRLAQDPELAARVKENPVEAIADLAAPLESDVWIYRIVVGSLALAVLAVVIGAVLLAMNGRPIPEVLVAVGAGAVGAMAGLLAPSPAGSRK